jgi:hypothetical protein
MRARGYSESQSRATSAAPADRGGTPRLSTARDRSNAAAGARRCPTRPSPPTHTSCVTRGVPHHPHAPMEPGSPKAAAGPRSPTGGGLLPPQVRLAEEVAATRKRVAQLKADVEAAQAENARLGDELAAAQAANMDLQTEVTAAAAERRAAETRLVGVQQDAADVQRQAEELEAVRALGAPGVRARGHGHTHTHTHTQYTHTHEAPSVNGQRPARESAALLKPVATAHPVAPHSFTRDHLLSAPPWAGGCTVGPLQLASPASFAAAAVLAAASRRAGTRGCPTDTTAPALAPSLLPPASGGDSPALRVGRRAGRACRGRGDSRGGAGAPAGGRCRLEAGILGARVGAACRSGGRADRARQPAGRRGAPARPPRTA